MAETKKDKDKKLKNMQISAPTTVNLDDLQTIIERNTLFQKKAMETKLLHDTFKFLEFILDFVTQLGGIKTVFKSNWIKTNSKAWLNLNSQFSSWILMMYHRQESEDKPWTHIFHEFLHKEGYKRRNILTRQSVESYYKLTKAFLSHLPQELRLEAEEICRFFERNPLDPYSSVIGLYATEEVINAAMEVDEISLSQMVERELEEFNKSKKSTYKERYTEVLRKITIWSKYNDPLHSVLEMQNFLSVLRGMNQIAQGSIVLVKKEVGNEIVQRIVDKNPPKKWIFARVARVSPNFLLVFEDPTEDTLTTYTYEDVLPLAKDIEEKYFHKMRVEELEKVVELDSDIQLKEFKSFCHSKVKEFLAREIDLDLLNMAINLQCNIRHISVLNTMQEKLKEFPQSTLNEVKELYSQTISKFIEKRKSLPSWASFCPTIEAREASLLHYHSEEVLLSEFRRYQMECQNAITHLLNEKRDLINGNKKQEVSSWWLSHVSKSVEEFLVKNGYEKNAVPHNYLDEPPKNILDVKKNLVLLKRIITSFNTTDIFKLKVVIKDICSRIYPVINSYADDIKYVVCDILNIDIEKYSHEEALSLAENISDANLKSDITDLIKDKKYLEEMEEIEEAMASVVRMDVIPISGLVMSKLCRIENEAKSVLDLWEPTSYAKLEEEVRTPIENAIISSDIKTIESLLKNGTNFINEQDGNGWTILHLCCSFCYNQPRLDVCKFLLEQNEIDVAIVNNSGNTALHYLVRMPIQEVQIPLYIQVLKIMLKNVSLAFTANQRGETPLHNAALAANSVAIKELFVVLADPNAQTSTGDTPLHYAVQSQNIDVLNLLIENGADSSMKNKNGELPIDLATRMNQLEMVKILRQGVSAATITEVEKKKLQRMLSLKTISEAKKHDAIWKRQGSSIDIKSNLKDDEKVQWKKNVPPEMFEMLKSKDQLSDNSSLSLTLSDGNVPMTEKIEKSNSHPPSAVPTEIPIRSIEKKKEVLNDDVQWRKQKNIPAELLDAIKENDLSSSDNSISPKQTSGGTLRGNNIKEEKSGGTLRGNKEEKSHGKKQGKDDEKVQWKKNIPPELLEAMKTPSSDPEPLRSKEQKNNNNNNNNNNNDDLLLREREKKKNEDTVQWRKSNIPAELMEALKEVSPSPPKATNLPNVPARKKPTTIPSSAPNQPSNVNPNAITTTPPPSQPILTRPVSVVIDRSVLDSINSSIINKVHQQKTLSSINQTPTPSHPPNNNNNNNNANNANNETKRQLPVVPTVEYRKALWKKTMDEEGELAFEAGDIITIIKKDNSGWWKGKIGNQIGIFPENYTSAYTPPPGTKPK